ncbi:MAG TPA: tetratricopeptide repeat protein, partial [Allocoleopsis sp.]
MDDSLLPVIYLSILLVLLSVAAILLFRQVLKTRRIESTLNRLQAKLTKEKGTPKEYYELGSILLDKKLYSQAITLFQKALKGK